MSLLRRTGFSCAVAVLAGVAAACGSSTETAPKQDLVPATLTAVTTDTIRGQVGAQGSLPLSVVVKNAAGTPLDTTLVTFTVLSGNGTLANSSVRTNATGQAQTTWTLGSAVGLQTATATVGTLAPVTFRAVATVGVATTLTKVQGDNQTAVANTTVGTAPQVQVVDRFGNPVPGQAVTFSVASGGGLVNGGAVTTGADGKATVGSWKLGTALGANSLLATAGSLTATFTATATIGTAAVLTLTPTDLGQLFVGQTGQLTSKVVDANGNTIPNAPVTYLSSNAAIASVSPAGVVTAVGAGTATITATSGSAGASAVVSVIGHPAGTTIASTLSFTGTPPTDIAFTKNTMLVALGFAKQIVIEDASGVNELGRVTLPQTANFVVAPTRAAGPAVGITIAQPSRLWFIDPASATLVDSLDINDLVISTGITSDGKKLFALQSDGELAIIDGQSHQLVTKLLLGGGVTQIRVAPGDTTVYALTNVGVVFDIDARTNAVRRQIPASLASADFAIGPDNTFYLLDPVHNVVNSYDITQLRVIRVTSVAAFATTIALTPDGQQIWLTHTNPAQVSKYLGDNTNGFGFGGTILTSNSAPSRAYVSPIGSFVAVANPGGWVDIIR